MRIALAQINPTIGAIRSNSEKIIHNISEARKGGAELVLFPEMTLCGYFPHDLLLLPVFIEAVSAALESIIAATQGIAVIVGCVRHSLASSEKALLNSAAIIQDGQLLGFHDKILLPVYDVFSERRYFEPGSLPRVWDIMGKKVGVTICEDIWQHAGAVEYSNYLRDPVEELKKLQPDLLVNLSASPFYGHRLDTRLSVCAKAACTLNCPLFFCNQVGGNDSLIFDGYSLCLDAKGELTGHAKGFEEELLVVESGKKGPSLPLHTNPLEDLYQALVLGVRDYFHKLNWKKACLGLSGGIDSALVAVIAKEALGAENVLALFLPSRYTPKQSCLDAQDVARNLGLELEEISIEKPFEAFLEILQPRFANQELGIAEENLQARIRGNILMAYANKRGYLLLSTANKSEMAMGYSTLYGDLCGALAVLSDLTKTQVYALVNHINQNQEVIPASVILKAPSAELRFDQKDSDSLPEYAIVDAVLEGYVEEHLSLEEIANEQHLSLVLVQELVRKIHLNEYKRRQAPPGLRVTKKAFSAGRIFPIVQHWNMQL